jgi:hypothetical protein
MIERIRILDSGGSGHPPIVPSQHPPSTPTTNNEDVPRVPPASTTARQAANQREEAVQGRCPYLPPGSRARRLTARDSSKRLSGGGSWAEIIFRPPIDGRSQLTPERLRRRLRLATSSRSASAYARSLLLSGHEPPPEDASHTRASAGSWTWDGQEHGYSPLNRLFFIARTQGVSRRKNTSARPPPRPPRVKNIPAEARGLPATAPQSRAGKGL